MSISLERIDRILRKDRYKDRVEVFMREFEYDQLVAYDESVESIFKILEREEVPDLDMIKRAQTLAIACTDPIEEEDCDLLLEMSELVRNGAKVENGRLVLANDQD